MNESLQRSRSRQLLHASQITWRHRWITWLSHNTHVSSTIPHLREYKGLARISEGSFWWEFPHPNQLQQISPERQNGWVIIISSIEITDYMYIDLSLVTWCPVLKSSDRTWIWNTDLHIHVIHVAPVNTCAEPCIWSWRILRQGWWALNGTQVVVETVCWSRSLDLCPHCQEFGGSSEWNWMYMLL